MSYRVIKKLGLKAEDLAVLGNDGSDTEADLSSSSGAIKKQMNVNRYDLLNQQSPSESDVKEDDDHETSISSNACDGAAHEIKGDVKRKKKKKKRKSGKGHNNARSSEDNIEDEVERSVREVNEILGPSEGASAFQQKDVSIIHMKSSMSIDKRHLHPKNELKRVFGLKISQSDQNKRKIRNKGHIRSTWLIIPKENWPTIGKTGIKMSIVPDTNGIFFKFEHSDSYQQIQKKFLEAVESHEPSNITSIVQNYPYHIDSLLQLADLCRIGDEAALGVELVQRALYCLECSFHPSFNFATGHCRLDYRREENRSLFIALFKHIINVGAQACYRTALELCKVLLALDPADPLAIILSIDFYALRASEFEWLIQFVEELDPIRNLTLMPNTVFSIAIAHHHLGKDSTTADLSLQKALLMFPGVLLPLLEKCCVQPDSKVSTHSFFHECDARQTVVITQLISLYVHRCYHLWKDPALLAWLEKNVAVVIERVDANDPLADEWVDKRLTLFRQTPLPIQRHIMLSGFRELVALAPEGQSAPVFSYDPLPPPDSINIYSRPQTRRHVNDETGFFSSLFQPLMVHINQNLTSTDDEHGGHSDHEEDNGAAAPSFVDGIELVSADLRRSVTSLLDAMRDMLTNIHMPDIPGDGDVEDGDSDDN